MPRVIEPAMPCKYRADGSDGEVGECRGARRWPSPAETIQNVFADDSVSAIFAGFDDRGLILCGVLTQRGAGFTEAGSTKNGQKGCPRSPPD